MILGMIIILILVILARKSKIHTSHFIWWAPLLLLIFMFAFFPTLIDRLGELFTVSYPPIIIIIAGLGLLLIKVLINDIYITKNELRYKKLAQKTALLEKTINEQAEIIQSLTNSQN